MRVLQNLFEPRLLLVLSCLIQTNAGKDYPEYGQPVANYDNGKTQLARYQDYGENPRYGKCWTGALARVHEGISINVENSSDWFNLIATSGKLYN